MVSFNNKKGGVEAKDARVLHPPKCSEACFHLLLDSVFSVGNCQLLEPSQSCSRTAWASRTFFLPVSRFWEKVRIYLRERKKISFSPLEAARCRWQRIQGLLCPNTSLPLYQRDQKIGRRGMKGFREVALQAHFYPDKMQVNITVYIKWDLDTSSCHKSCIIFEMGLIDF